MAKKKTGEQIPLIDVSPEYAKPLVDLAGKYKEAQERRMEALAEEIQYKKEILDAMKKAEVPVGDDGKMKFEYEGIKITVTPRDELVQVKEKKVTADDPDNYDD